MAFHLSGCLWIVPGYRFQYSDYLPYIAYLLFVSLLPIASLVCLMQHLHQLDAQGKIELQAAKVIRVWKSKCLRTTSESGCGGYWFLLIRWSSCRNNLFQFDRQGRRLNSCRNNWPAARQNQTIPTAAFQAIPSHKFSKKFLGWIFQLSDKNG